MMNDDIKTMMAAVANPNPESYQPDKHALAWHRHKSTKHIHNAFIFGFLVAICLVMVPVCFVSLELDKHGTYSEKAAISRHVQQDISFYYKLFRWSLSNFRG